MTETTRSETMRGHAEVREFVESLGRAVPDFTLERVGPPLVASDGPRAACWWRGWGTKTGRIYGQPATGKRWELEGADFHEYRDGKIARLRVVYDMADFLRQLGLLPGQASTERSDPTSEAG
jgi:steroid delta-isomerase-like uncharacterized protein